MKQVLLRKGKVSVQDVPSPLNDEKNILVEVHNSLISTGTEMASVQLSAASLIDKAKQRPQEMAKVFESIRVRGIKKTLMLVQSKLDEWKALGYSCSGEVIAVGQAVNGFQVGDRVACAGAAIANHAEVISVPSKLVVPIPSKVDDKSACFVTLGSIALQGVRRADVRLGEVVCVMGLGLIGQITSQLLKAAGCKVVGMDLDASRVDMALKLGMDLGASSFEDLALRGNALTGEMGFDATLITASTASSEPAQRAFEATRKKGRIVVVGAVGMDLKRSPFYEKEQDFLISCSYGPGRYDPVYENQGQDYPYAYVRWTENRNMRAFLELISDHKINVERLIDQEISINQAEKAYELLGQKNGKKPLAIVLAYTGHTSSLKKSAAPLEKTGFSTKGDRIRLGLIGVGNFTKSMHIPNLQSLRDRFEIKAVCAANSASAKTVGSQLDCSLIETDYRGLLNSSEVDAVLISTRHDNHAEIAQAALKAGKHVYLEKPLALTHEELEALDQLVRALNPCPVFMVGFNRRYAPLIQEVQRFIGSRVGPLLMAYRVNAGDLPPHHWSKTAEGGGRLRGEACHMVDLFQALVQAPLRYASIDTVHKGDATHLRPDENFSAQFAYEDGSLGSLIYTSLGHSSLPKERIEIHWDGQSAVLDDFKRLILYGAKEKHLTSVQDKGHLKALELFFDSIKKGHAFPTPWEQLVETTQATIELDRDVWGKTSPVCAAS